MLIFDDLQQEALPCVKQVVQNERGLIMALRWETVIAQGESQVCNLVWNTNYPWKQQPIMLEKTSA